MRFWRSRWRLGVGVGAVAALIFVCRLSLGNRRVWSSIVDSRSPCRAILIVRALRTVSGVATHICLMVRNTTVPRMAAGPMCEGGPRKKNSKHDQDEGDYFHCLLGNLVLPDAFSLKTSLVIGSGEGHRIRATNLLPRPGPRSMPVTRRYSGY
jgi:hypothetical protein